MKCHILFISSGSLFLSPLFAKEPFPVYKGLILTEKIYLSSMLEMLNILGLSAENLFKSGTSLFRRNSLFKNNFTMYYQRVATSLVTLTCMIVKKCFCLKQC